VNHPAHQRVNEKDASERYKQEKRAQNERHRPRGKAVQPGSQDFDDGPQADLKDAVRAPLPDVFVFTATVWPSPPAS
jgi:hypothetical protein